MPVKRKTSPKRVKRKTSPRRVKRKTSPRRVKRKTSPRRVKRKTSPKRKRRMNGIGDYFRRRAGKEVARDDPGEVEVDWPGEETDSEEEGFVTADEISDEEDTRPSRQDSAGPGRPRAREYSNLSEDRLGTGLLTLLESVESCKDVVNLSRTGREMRYFIMNNIPVLYTNLKSKNTVLPDLEFTGDIQKDFELFVKTCGDLERLEALRTFSIDQSVAEEGPEKFRAYKKYLKQLIHGGFDESKQDDAIEARIIASDVVVGRYDERVIETAIKLHNLGFDDLTFRLLRELPYGYLTMEQFKFIELIMSDSYFSSYSPEAVVELVSGDRGVVRGARKIIKDYTSGKLTEKEAMSAFRDIEYYRRHSSVSHRFPSAYM